MTRDNRIWTVDEEPDALNRQMNEMIRGRLAGRPVSAETPEEPGGPVVDIARVLGFANPELAARAVAGEAGEPVDALRELARVSPEMLVPPVDFGGGPRGRSAEPLSMNERMNRAIREGGRW